MFGKFKIAAFAVTFTAIIAVITSCSKQVVTDDTIVATWDDTSITVADFKYFMGIRHRDDYKAMKQPLEERFTILNEYLERDLKLIEARRLGYHEREDAVKAYNDALERKATDLLYDEKIRNSAISEEMIRDFYEHDKEEVRVRHILIKVPEDSKGRDTVQFYDRIQEVYRRAKAGESFVNLVDQYSEDETVDRSFHGDLGFFPWGKMVDPFQEAAWKLNPGEISPPVRTRYGWHIIQMIERRPSGLQVRTSHILVKVTRRAVPAESLAAYERAKMIYEEAIKPNADFAQLARRFSEDEDTWVSGDVGWVPRGTMPSEYWDAAMNMEVGEISKPVRTYKGYHIIKVTDKRVEDKPLSDPEKREEIISKIARIYRVELKAITDAFIDSVKKSFGMEYNQTAINLLLKKLNDESAPANMNRFSLLTPEEREMMVVTDNLGGVKIDTLVAMYGDHRFPPNYRNEKEFIYELVDPIIMPRYLGEIARREGYTNHPEALKEAKRASDNAILPEIEREMVFNKAAPTEDEIKDYYQKNIAKYTQAATATIYEIMVDDRQLAEDLLGRIKKGENIQTLARRYTLRTKSKRDGGLLGPFTRDQYGAVSQKAFDLQPGEIAGPIQSGDMYSIIQLKEKAPEKVNTLDEIRRQIESEVRFNRQKGIKEAWVAALRKKYSLKIYDDVVKAVWPVIEPLPEAMVAERKKWREEREEIGEKAKLRAEEDKIKLKLKPGSTQTFRRGDKDIKVQIGQPRYVGKDGKEVEPSKSKVVLTPKGELKERDGSKVDKTQKPVIKLKPNPPETTPKNE